MIRLDLSVDRLNVQPDQYDDSVQCELDLIFKGGTHNNRGTKDARTCALRLNRTCRGATTKIARQKMRISVMASVTAIPTHLSLCVTLAELTIFNMLTYQI